MLFSVAVLSYTSWKSLQNHSCVASRVSHETPRGAQDNTGELGKYPLCPAVCLGKGWAEVLQAKLGMPVDVRALCFTQSP